MKTPIGELFTPHIGDLISVIGSVSGEVLNEVFGFVFSLEKVETSHAVVDEEILNRLRN